MATAGRLAALMLCLAFTAAVAHAHESGPGSWIANGKFYSPIDGVHCCGEHDCFPVDDNDIEQQGNGDHLIRSMNELVPAREVQWSRDGQYWRCKKYDGTRRCFFAPPPAT